jgi:hypothetical protein
MFDVANMALKVADINPVRRTIRDFRPDARAAQAVTVQVPVGVGEVS